MADKAVRVLVVEDKEEDYLLTHDLLANANGGSLYEFSWARSYNDGLRQIRRQEHDVYLVDHFLDEHSGLDLLHAVAPQELPAPIIMLTCTGRRDIDIEALRIGAADYLVKEFVDKHTLDRSIRYAIAQKKNELRLRKDADALDKLNKKLTQRNVRMEELSRQKNQFLGIAAHDLRTPLDVILGFSHLLLSGRLGPIPENRLVFVRKIAESSHHMLQLVNDFLDMSNIEAGALKLEKQATNLAELVAENVNFNAPIASEKDIALTYDKPPLFPLVSIDTDQIDQVLNNLLSNAIKFSHPGTTIDIALEQRDQVACIAVSDQGQGIPEDELPGLLQPYPKTSVRSTAGEKSTGLGLALSRKIVEAHLGRLEVESVVGKGSTFTVCLPVDAPT